MNVVSQVCDEDLYHYGFNGKMKDNEWAGIENHNTAEFWEYDTRTGRRGNIDPIPIEWSSSYSVFFNNSILLGDPFGDKVRYESKEEKKDVEYLRKHDKEFDSKFRKWQEEYSGKRDLFIKKLGRNGTVTLNDPNPVSGGRDGSVGDYKNIDHLFYSAISGSEQGTYSIFNMSKAEQWEYNIITSPGQNFSQQSNVSTTLNQDNFLHWSIINSSESAKDAFLNYTNLSKFDNENMFNTALNISIKNNNYDFNKDHLTSYGSATYTFYIQAISKPTIIKVPKGKKGRLQWNYSIDNYKLIYGEQPSNATPHIFVNHGAIYLNNTNW
jgi:hypothetical protein